MRIPSSIALVGLLAACTAAPPPAATPPPVSWQRLDGKQIDLAHLRQTRVFCDGEAARANPLPGTVAQPRYQPGITRMGDAIADLSYAIEVREARERADYERQVARERLSMDCMAQQGYGPLD
jgi:hypothetical protein